MANTIHQATLGGVAQRVEAKLTGDGNTLVVDVTHDSRQVESGWLFVAIRGAKRDGNKFVDDVLARGACGVVSEQPCPNGFAAAWLQVADARLALAQIAAYVQGFPSRELDLIGITGTNGKTTTAYLVHGILEAANKRTALISTIETRIGAERVRAERTTPEASDLQRFLRRSVTAGARAAVMECSSQALDLHRCDSLDFRVAVWTNLTRDHLDYHHTMEEYFAAKRRLFDGSLGSVPRTAIINIDDEYGARLLHELRGQETRARRQWAKESGQSPDESVASRPAPVSYSLDAAADVTASDLQISLRGMEFRARTPAGACAFHSPLIGRPHVYNILAATATALALGCELDEIARGVEICTGAPGRFEPVPHAGDFTVVVDYAHTDDALKNILQTAREVAPRGRVITVFGCGGDRDRTKRLPMGEAAARGSDIVFLTSDNPRTEDPQQILRDAEAGLRNVGTPYRVIADRSTAIHEAIAEARSGDIVVIAGKGHEDYQIIGTETFHFDDREVARAAVAARDAPRS